MKINHPFVQKSMIQQRKLQSLEHCYACRNELNSERNRLVFCKIDISSTTHYADEGLQIFHFLL